MTKDLNRFPPDIGRSQRTFETLSSGPCLPVDRFDEWKCGEGRSVFDRHVKNIERERPGRWDGRGLKEGLALPSGMRRLEGHRRVLEGG